MVVIWFAIFLLWCGYLYLTKNYDYWKTLGIRFEKPYPLVGSLLDVALMKKSDGELMNDVYRKYPGEKVVGMFLFKSSLGLVVRDPSIIHNILVRDFHHFANNDHVFLDEELDPILAKNIFFLKDDLWKNRRAILSPAFTANRVKLLYPQMKLIAQDFMKYLADHPEEVEVKDAAALYTGEIVARCAFGIDGNSFTDPEPIMVKIGNAIFGKMGIVMSIKFYIALMVPFLKKTLQPRAVSNEALDLLRSIINDVVAYRKRSAEEWHDVIQHLIDTKERDSKMEGDVNTKFTDEDILAGCLMVFVEGYEASSAVLAHVLYNLALNKRVQHKLQQEIDEAFTNCKQDWLLDTISELPYLHNVLQESNRIFPTSYGFTKTCTEKYEMDIGSQKTITVEKDTTIMIPSYAIYNDPLYWSDVDQFKPERFANHENSNRIKGVYLPFGEGPRMCIGFRMATALIKTGLVHILRDFEIVPSARTPLKLKLDPTHFMLSHRGGLYLKFVKRTQ